MPSLPYGILFFLFFLHAACQGQIEEETEVPNAPPDEEPLFISPHPIQPTPSATASITPFHFFQFNDFQTPSPSSSSFEIAETSVDPESSAFPEISQTADPSPQLYNLINQTFNGFMSPETQIPEFTPGVSAELPVLPSPMESQLVPSSEPIESPAENNAMSQTPVVKTVIAPLESLEPITMESPMASEMSMHTPEPDEAPETPAASGEPRDFAMRTPIASQPVTETITALLSSEEPSEGLNIVITPQPSNEITETPFTSPQPPQSTPEMQPLMPSQTPQETMEIPQVPQQPAGPTETPAVSELLFEPMVVPTAEIESSIPPKKLQETMEAPYESEQPTETTETSAVSELPLEAAPTPIIVMESTMSSQPVQETLAMHSVLELPTESTETRMASELPFEPMVSLSTEIQAATPSQKLQETMEVPLISQTLKGLTETPMISELPFEPIVTPITEMETPMTSQLMEETEEPVVLEPTATPVETPSVSASPSPTMSVSSSPSASISVSASPSATMTMYYHFQSNDFPSPSMSPSLSNSPPLVSEKPSDSPDAEFSPEPIPSPDMSVSLEAPTISQVSEPSPMESVEFTEVPIVSVPTLIPQVSEPSIIDPTRTPTMSASPIEVSTSPELPTPEISATSYDIRIVTLAESPESPEITMTVEPTEFLLETPILSQSPSKSNISETPPPSISFIPSPVELSESPTIIESPDVFLPEESVLPSPTSEELLEPLYSAMVSASPEYEFTEDILTDTPSPSALTALTVTVEPSSLPQISQPAETALPSFTPGEEMSLEPSTEIVTISESPEISESIRQESTIPSPSESMFVMQTLEASESPEVSKSVTASTTPWNSVTMSATAQPSKSASMSISPIAETLEPSETPELSQPIVFTTPSPSTSVSVTPEIPVDTTEKFEPALVTAVPLPSESSLATLTPLPFAPPPSVEATLPIKSPVDQAETFEPTVITAVPFPSESSLPTMTPVPSITAFPSSVMETLEPIEVTDMPSMSLPMPSISPSTRISALESPSESSEPSIISTMTPLPSFVMETFEPTEPTEIPTVSISQPLPSISPSTSILPYESSQPTILPTVTPLPFELPIISPKEPTVPLPGDPPSTRNGVGNVLLTPSPTVFAGTIMPMPVSSVSVTPSVGGCYTAWKKCAFKFVNNTDGPLSFDIGGTKPDTPFSTALGSGVEAANNNGLVPEIFSADSTTKITEYGGADFLWNSIKPIQKYIVAQTLLGNQASLLAEKCIKVYFTEVYLSNGTNLFFPDETDENCVVFKAL